MIIVFLVASGWMSIRFSKLLSEIRKNYLVYLYVFVSSNAYICSVFFITGPKISPCDLMMIIYMLFIILTARKSYLNTKEIGNSLLFESYHNEYSKCISIKQYRFKTSILLGIFTSIFYSIMILFVNTGLLSSIENKNYLRILFDDIIIMFLLVLYKPSSIILKYHVNPTARLSPYVSI